MAKFQDFKELLTLLKEKNVKYLIVGGQAVIFYSRGKLTEDLDIWVKPTQENAKKIIGALSEFGYGDLDISESDFVNKNMVIQIGYPPMRVDFMTSIEGLDFDEAYKKKSKGYLFGLKNQPYISFDDLLKNKKNTGRPKDKFDILWLKKYFNPKKIK
ncbi:MAG: nucleotidyltransferase [Chlorobi bacterium]|nr:nucleotidyltransferase [Chlorobiota bacterium]MCI0715991.1 nucleotidyltransferase [Chlorobiota bacterium]